MVLKKLKDYLDRHGVHYEVLTHREAFTAQELAAAMHVPGREMAKVVVVKSGDRYLMAVLPAHHRLDLEKLRAITGRDVSLATEAEMASLFPDCEVGAMPPFGNLYQLEVYVDRSLSEDESIVFNAGTHHEAMRASYQDFAKLVQPKVVDISVHA